jgi:hypothetical protein
MVRLEVAARQVKAVKNVPSVPPSLPEIDKWEER